MFVLLVVALIAVILFHIVFYHKYNWPSFVKKVNAIPGPKGVFYFGSALRTYFCKPEDLIQNFYSDFKTYGATVRYWYSGIPVIGVTNPDDIQIVLNARAASGKGFVYKHLKPWLGQGLLTAGGQKWAKMRKIITPTFHFSILRSFLDVFNKNTDIMLQLLHEFPDKTNVDLYKLVTYCTLDNVCETAMGTCINAQVKEGNGYVQALLRMEHILMERVRSPLYYTDHMFSFSSLGREHSKLIKVLHETTKKIIAEKKNLRSANPQAVQESPTLTADEEGLSEDNVYKKKYSFLELLLDKQEENNLSDEEIREEVDVFLFTGHDTTSGTLNWTFFELGHHPQIQNNVYNELHQLFGDSDRAPTYQDLMEMSYLKRVILETLRLHPTVPFIMRKFDTDIQLQKYLVPANTEVVISILYAHINPEIFPNPEKFDPDRFLPEEVDKRHPFAYVPFSAGQRNCIGQRFGMLQMMTIMSAILRRFKIECHNNRDTVKAVPAVLLKPNTDFRFRITNR